MALLAINSLIGHSRFGGGTGLQVSHVGRQPVVGPPIDHSVSVDSNFAVVCNVFVLRDLESGLNGAESSDGDAV
jgi:hypothetical protein